MTTQEYRKHRDEILKAYWQDDDPDNPEAKQALDNLFLELIGEDEDARVKTSTIPRYYTGSLTRNKLRAELRNLISKTGEHDERS